MLEERFLNLKLAVLNVGYLTFYTQSAKRGSFPNKTRRFDLLHTKPAAMISRIYSAILLSFNLTLQTTVLIYVF